MDQTLVIAENESGTFVMRAELSPLLRDYLVSLADLSGNASPLKEGRIFDAAAIRKELQSRPGIIVRKAATPASNVLELGVRVGLPAGPAQRPCGADGHRRARLCRRGRRSTLRIHLTGPRGVSASRLLPAAADPVLLQLGPQGSGQVTDDDYLAMIRFSIGDAAPGLLKKSFVTVIDRPSPRGELLGRACPLDHQSGQRKGRGKRKKGNRYIGAVTGGGTPCSAGRTQTREGARRG